MSFEMWTSLVVEDFYHGDRSSAFEAASYATDEAERIALLEIRDELGFKRRPPRIRVASSEFVEFDSGNLSHAGAHFKVMIDGLTDEETACLKALQESGV